MGNKSVKAINTELSTNVFTIDRLLDPRYKIYVGCLVPTDKLFSNQGIRIGDDRIKRLESFSESLNQLNYQFEENTHLKILRSEDRVFYIHLRSGDKEFSFTMDSLVIKHWKSISFNSMELDRITDFCK